MSALLDDILRREIAPRLGGERFASFWFIARSRAVRRRAMTALGAGAVAGHFFSPFELSARLSARLCDGVPVLTPVERRALVGSLAGRVRPGLQDALVSAIGELAAAGVRDGDALPEGLLRTVFVRYRQRLAALGFRDPDERLGLVAAAIESGRIEVPEVVIFDHPGRADAALVRSLTARVPRLIVVGDEGERPPCARRVVAFADRRAEVDGIATAIRAVLSEGARPDEVVVAFAAFDDYAPLVRERFVRFGIPFDLDVGVPLATVPVVRAAFAIVEAVLAGLSRTAVERALISPYVRFSQLSWARFDRLARKAGVVGGGGASAIEREWIEPLGRLEDAQDAVMQLAPLARQALALLGELDRPRAPRAAVRALVQVWERLGLVRRAARDADFEVLRRDAHAWARWIALAEETASGLELGGVESIALRDLCGHLRAAVADERLALAPPVRARRVQVVRLTELAGLSASHLFVGGLDEASLPGPTPPVLLLGESDRARLGLRTQAEVQDELRRAIAAMVARERVVLSFPRGELSAEDAAASFLGELGVAIEDGDGQVGPAAAHTEERRQRLLAAATSPPLLHGGVAPARAIEAAIVAEVQRERPVLGAWDGMLLAAGVSDGLRSAVATDLSARMMGAGASASQLDELAGCPFKFYADRGLSLKELDDPLAVDYTLAGKLVHAILCDFYRSLRESVPALLAGPAECGGDQAWIEGARPHLRAAFARQLDRLRPPRADAFFAELARQLDEPQGLLEAFLRSEAAALWDHEPIAFELPFGESRHGTPDGDRRLPELVVEVSGGEPVRLLGSIDRIDRLRDGRGAVVFDYKTGRSVPRKAQMAAGYRFQLAVYVAAIACEHAPRGGGYYRLAEAAEVERDLVFGTGGLDVGTMMARLPDAVRHLAGAARGGRFHAGHLSPRDKGCGYCEYHTLCRVDHDRLHALALRGADGLLIPLPLSGSDS